ncbi:dihydrolipoamide acetyltransferase family protein [Crossiella cryophila]|uniref:Dihydrolipoamide acetyltransferase component of pyruvate dehydrogenase complex n=1 Tax=Crossiella cryophila TaxID=43355 RepID=A0A7W7CIF0_9PSEU|nr:dihydrolipoamide acetyltransferase family protein [Crossiella cryophila]MBB4680328.1 pyruvate dehydrogenase E2 component (dihydrolipoamide acetyltransferase) [Crossiella cryophila]
MTQQVFRLPDLGEGLTEAEVVSWRVAVGDTVTVDQVVVEVETAKAAVEVPIPFAGTVLTLHGEAGAVLEVGKPLITVSGEGTHETYRTEERAGTKEPEGSGNVLIGYGTKEDNGSRRRRRRQPAPALVAAVPAPEPALAPRVINPLVRGLAKQHDIDLSAITPSGPAGIVLRKDVEAAIAAAGNAPAAVTLPDAGGPERIPLRGLRRAVADKLSRSRTEIPDATTWVDADATALLAAKKAVQAACPEQKIGLLALFGRICVAGLKRYPELNSSVDGQAREILRWPHINLGFAAQTDRGLVVPVVRNADRLSTAELAAAMAALTERARTGTLEPADLTGGTFTLNNYGVFGVDGSTPIINHPEAAMLGIGRIIDRPWAVDGQLAVRKITQLSFTFDHRVCDGGVAGGFLRFVADAVESPLGLLARL